MTNKKHRMLFMYGGMFLVLLGLCYLFPYTNDDWAWGSQIGLDRLSNWFDNYSGRYFGNLIVIALTRSNLLKTVVMAFCITGIVFILNEITKRQKCGFVLICLFLIFMPLELLKQSIVWTSGFSNYATSIFLTLIYIYYVNSMYDKKPKNSIISPMFLLILGFSNTLIVEHMTIYNVVLSIYVIVFTIVKYKKVFIQNIAYFIGCICGTATMFSNNCYSNVSQGTDGYRTMATESSSIVDRVIQNFCQVIVKEGVLNNYILLCGLLIAVLIIWFSIKSVMSNKAKFIGGVSVAILTAYTAAAIMNQLAGVMAQAEILLYFEALATIFYFVAFAAFILVLPFEIMHKVKLMFILFSAACMMAPLTVVTPISSRCFFASFIMLVYLAIELYSHFTEEIKEKFAKVNKVLAVAAAVSIIYLFYIYGTICKNSNERIEKAQTEAAKGKSTVEVQELPYKNYVLSSDIYDAIYESRFKLYYDIDQNVKLNMVPHK